MAEKYRPLFKLDAGGMAEVYVAEAESMAGFKKKVAIKRILPGLNSGRYFSAIGRLPNELAEPSRAARGV